MNKLFNEKKSRYKNLLLILLPFMIIAGVLAYFSYKSATNIIDTDGSISTPSNVIEKYNYTLRSNATDLQKELFEELKEDFKNEDETDKLKIAEDIAKNYIADMYTWTNKQGRFDVGGMCYINGYYKYNNWMQATNGFYRYVSKYIEEYGAEDLIEVESIEIVDSYKDSEKYTIGDNSNFEKFHVDAKWEYKETVRFDTSKFAKKLHFTLVRDESGNYNIVESY